jgi:hypothetical protein
LKLPDAECLERYPDDVVISDEVDLLRRIPPWHFHADPNTSITRPSSAAFEDDEDGHPMSVYRSDVIEQTGRNPDRVLRGHENFALAAVRAGLVRSHAQTVHHDPLPDEHAHTVVCGRKPKSVLRQLAMNCRWIVQPKN